MLPSGSLKQIVDFFTANPFYSDEIKGAVLEFFNLKKIEDFADLELSTTQEGIFNEWVLFDFKLENGNNLIQEYREVTKQHTDQTLLSLYDDLIKTQNFGFFEVISVRIDEGLTMRDLKTDTIYEVKEKSATHNLRPGNIFFNRVAKVGDHWELVGADNNVLPTVETTENIRNIFRKDKKKLTAKDAFGFAKEKKEKSNNDERIIDAKQARFRLAELLVKAEINQYISVEKIVEWFQNIESKNPIEFVSIILGLVPDKYDNTPIINEITHAFIDVQNTSPQKDLNGKSPQQKNLENPSADAELIWDVNKIGGDKCWMKLEKANKLMNQNSFVSALDTWYEVFDLLIKEFVVRHDIYRMFANKAVCHFACGEEKMGKKMLQLALSMNPNYEFAKKQMAYMKDDDWKERMLYAHFYALRERMDNSGLSAQERKKMTLVKAEIKFGKRDTLKNLKDDSAMKYFDYISKFGINFATAKPTTSKIVFLNKK